MYVLGLNEPDIYKLRPEKYKTGASWLSGVWLNALGANASGTFSAVDLNSGRIAWQQKMQTPNGGWSAGDGRRSGVRGEQGARVLRFDAQRGDTLWHYSAPAAVNAPPVSSRSAAASTSLSRRGACSRSIRRVATSCSCSLSPTQAIRARCEGEHGIGVRKHTLAPMRSISLRWLGPPGGRGSRLQGRRTGRSAPWPCARAAARRSCSSGRPVASRRDSALLRN